MKPERLGKVFTRKGKGGRRVASNGVRCAQTKASYTPVRVSILCGDSGETCSARCRDLNAVFGEKALMGLLAITSRRLHAIIYGTWEATPDTRRLVWLLWTWRFEPGRLRTWFDVISWGKFCPPWKPPAKQAATIFKAQDPSVSTKEPVATGLHGSIES